MELLHTAHVPAGDGPFPTLIALHGWGASAHDLIGLAPYLHGGEALVICPQGPVALEIAPGALGYGWFPIGASGDGLRQLDPMEFRRTAVALEGFVTDALARYPVDRRKLVVAGFSQGGVMAYDLVLRDPTRFAGLAALSSWLPAALSDAIPKRSEHEAFPVLVQHGSDDPMIAVDRARESRDLLLPRGVQLSYREYEGMGHEISPESLRDWIEWLDAKVWSPIKLVL